MKLLRIATALSSTTLTLSLQAAVFDLTGQVSAKDSGDPIENARLTLQVTSANRSISGRIIDSTTSQGIAGAQVFVDVKPEIGGASPSIAITDSNGYYYLDGLAPEQYTIGVWKRGFATQYQMNLDLVSGQSLVQDLSIKPVEMSEDYIVLLRAEFDDVKFHPDHDEAWADQLFFDDTPGAASVRNFYYQLSHGHLDLKKGASALIQVTDPDLQYPHEDSDRDDIVDYLISASKSQINYNDPKLDRSASWDHEPGADDKIDHVVVMTAGLPKSITGSSCDMNPVSMLNSEYVTSSIRSPVQALVPEYSPLGNIAHEIFHSMGETAVQDLYIGGTCDTGDELSTPLGTVGKWGAMGIGMYNKLNQFLPDPRGDNCEAGYIDPCEGTDGMCTAGMFGEQPSMPVPWTMWKWYHKYFWNNGVLENVVVNPNDNQTIRLYPYSTSANGAQVITVKRSDSSQWWSITNRQPIGFDRGLIHSDTMEGQSGIVIDYNDSSLAGRMNLRGPVRIRDSHPGTLPDYTHYSCRARIDDAAFNIGEVDYYSEHELTVQLLQEHSDGSITVSVSTGGSSTSTMASPALMTTSLEQVKEEEAHTTHAHDEVVLEVTDAPKSTTMRQRMSLDPTQSSSISSTSSTQITTTDSNGQYAFDSVSEGEWTLIVDACAFEQKSQMIDVNGNEIADFELSEDTSRTIVSSIASPISGQTYSSNQDVQLDATQTSTFGNSTYEWHSDRDGLLASTAQASVSLSEGQHEISLTVTNEICASSTSVIIDVIEGQTNQIPTADFTYSANGLTVSFSDTSSDSDGNIVEWHWDFGDGQTSTEQNPTHSYPAEGDYSVALAVTDDAGGQAQVTQSVSVTDSSSDPAELTSGVAKTSINIASKDEQHYYISVPAGTDSMSINFTGDGDADLYVKAGQQANRNYGGYDYKAAGYGSDETIDVETPAADVWYIMVYAYSAVSSGSLQVDLSISGQNQSPNAEFTFSTDNLGVAFTDQSSDSDGTVTDWNWDFGDGNSSTAQSPNHVYAQAGSYQVTLTASDNEGAQDTVAKTVFVSEGGGSNDPYELQDGVAKSPIVVASKVEEMYHVTVPEGLTSLTITMSGDGDGDLYVKHGVEPTRNYGGSDYKATSWGSDESITVANPELGTWYIMVYGYREMTTGSLQADFN